MAGARRDRGDPVARGGGRDGDRLVPGGVRVGPSGGAVRRRRRSAAGRAGLRCHARADGVAERRSRVHRGARGYRRGPAEGDRMTEKYAYYPVFTSTHRVAGRESDPEYMTHQVEILLKEFVDRVEVRGVYSCAGFRADADLMMWWVADTPEDVQELLRRCHHTLLGKHLFLSHSFLG